MARRPTPLLTGETAAALRAAFERGDALWRGSLDLGRSLDDVAMDAAGFAWRGQCWPWPSTEERIKDRTVYRFDGVTWQPVQRFGGSLIKLVPTDWGPPTFEIDGIKMLPTAQVSPWDDAAVKVALVQPRGKRLLDCCGGLGYYAAHALLGGAIHVSSFEKNPDVVWLRGLNPWSPDVDDADAQDRFTLTEGDISKAITALPSARPAALRHRRRVVFVDLLRAARTRAEARRAAVPLHRQPERQDQRPRRARRGAQAPAEGRLPRRAQARRRVRDQGRGGTSLIGPAPKGHQPRPLRA
jgi:hypothetical protein